MQYSAETLKTGYRELSVLLAQRPHRVSIGHRDIRSMGLALFLEVPSVPEWRLPDGCSLADWA